MKFATTMDKPFDFSIFRETEKAADSYLFTTEDGRRWRAIHFDPSLQTLILENKDGELLTVSVASPPTEGSAE